MPPGHWTPCPRRAHLRRSHTRIRGALGGAPWVAGSEGMLVTLHKGRWKRLRTGLKVSLLGLWCASPAVVHVCGHDGTLAATRDDGGRPCRDVTPRGIRSITDVCVTASGPWFVGALERIVRTDDQGKTWHVEHALDGPMHQWVYALHDEADGSGVAVGPHSTAYIRAV